MGGGGVKSRGELKKDNDSCTSCKRQSIYFTIKLVRFKIFFFAASLHVIFNQPSSKNKNKDRKKI
jgi:hypothetical protein